VFDLLARQKMRSIAIVERVMRSCARQEHRHLMIPLGTTSGWLNSPHAEAGMLGDPNTNECNLLKDQFELLVHGERVRGDSMEMLFDDQIRRRFGEWITRAVGGKQNATTTSRCRNTPRRAGEH
jgi:hypothetical protein